VISNVMGVQPQTLEIIFEVQRKTSDEKITQKKKKKKKSLSNLENEFFFFFSILFWTPLMYFQTS
jgi:hypothetical protein